MTLIKNVATQFIVRIGWLPLLLVSTALHVGAVVIFLVAALPSVSHPLGASSPEVPSMLLQLRSEASISHTITVSIPLPIQTREKGTVPILSKSESLADKSAPAPNALALKDRPKPSSLRDAILSPSPAPRVNSRAGVVFILDISGSMYEPYAGSTRLALARQILTQRIRNLADGTPFAITVYGETALRSGPLVPANDATRDAAVYFLTQEHACGGSTNLPVGLALAQELDMGAIVLVTDGDLNMDGTELLPRVRQIMGATGQCPALTIVAIAPRAQTRDEQLLQEIAQQQGGTLQSSPDDNLTASLTPKKSDIGTP
jgi:hypothetical protein